MKPKEYWQIITKDVPGPSATKSEEIRVFELPSKFTVPDSSKPKEVRTMKIFAAFISESYVWVLSDFSGLVRMHVESRTEPWTRADLEPGSEVSVYI